MHLASDQKDLLISQLKAEIFEIQQRDKDFLALRDQLHSIQSKYRHLQDEKVSLTVCFGEETVEIRHFLPERRLETAPLKLPLEMMF